MSTGKRLQDGGNDKFGATPVNGYEECKLKEDYSLLLIFITMLSCFRQQGDS